MAEPSTLDLTRYYLERMSDVDLRGLEDIAQIMIPGLPSNFFSRPDPRINDLIQELPRLTEADLHSLGEGDGSCPICFVTYKAFLAEEEMASAMDHSAAIVPEELGVTKLVKSCGHIYCRKDIIRWMRTASKSCPTCRAPFLPPLEGAPPSDVATEGGEFGLLATEEEMADLRDRSTAPADTLENHLSRMGVFEDFQQFVLGNHGSTPTQRQEDHDDRSEYYGMYS